MKKSMRVVIAGLMALALLAACQPEKKEILTGHIKFVKGKVTLNGQKAKAGTEFSQNDTIKTGTNSTAILQIGKISVIAMKSKSTLVLQTYAKSADKYQIELKQSKGNSFHRVEKGKSKYAVAAPTAVAGVRGTSFSVKSDSKKSTFALLEGRLEVHHKSGKSVVFNEGKYVSTTSKKLNKTKKMSEKMKKSLTLLNTLNFSDQKIAAKAVSKDLLNELIGKKLVKKSKVKSKVIIEPNTHMGLRKKYGKLYEVRTQNGMVYIGAMRKRKGKYVVILPGDGGHIKLSKTQIKSKRELARPGQ